MILCITLKLQVHLFKAIVSSIERKIIEFYIESFTGTERSGQIKTIHAHAEGERRSSTWVNNSNCVFTIYLASALYTRHCYNYLNTTKIANTRKTRPWICPETIIVITFCLTDSIWKKSSAFACFYLFDPCVGSQKQMRRI